ncbi:MAG: DUF4397 domain-containing protein [Pseudomonadales bacterium]
MIPATSRPAAGRTLQTVAALALAALLAGCDSDNDNDNGGIATAPPPPRGTVEVIHASADAPAVNVLFDGVERISDLDYKAVDTLSLVTGDIAVRVNGILPDGSEVTVIPAAGTDPEITLAEDARVSVIALDAVANIAPLVLTDDTPTVAADTVRLRVVHAAPEVPAAGNTAVEVWLTEPGADLNNPPAGTINAVFSFGEVLAGGAIEVPEGDYRIRATLPGQPNVVAFDSGTVTLAGGSNLVVLAVPNTNAASASPISLLAATGAAPLQIQDQSTQSNVRVVHASSDAPPVDVLVNGANSGITVAFASSAGPVPLDAGTTNLGIGVSPFLAGDTPVFAADVDLIQGGAKTVLAVGTVAADPANPIEPLVLDDETRSVATEARVRIVHASVVAQTVDIYVLPEGTLTAVDPVPADVDPTFAAVPFKADTGYVALAEDAYDIAVTPAGSKDAAIGPLLSVPFTAGTLTTIVAIDEVNLGPSPSVLVLNDTP